MSKDLTAAVYATVDGERKQVGTSTSSNEGVRNLNLFEDFKSAQLENVEFEDNYETVAQQEGGAIQHTELPAAEPQLDSSDAVEVTPEQPTTKRR